MSITSGTVKCINNEMFENHIKIGGVYRKIPNRDCDRPHNYIRIIDETKEDNLYPKHYFVNVVI